MPELRLALEPLEQGQSAGNKSFLVLFFKKEHFLLFLKKKTQKDFFIFNGGPGYGI
jgi:hypothetical protein